MKTKCQNMCATQLMSSSNTSVRGRNASSKSRSSVASKRRWRSNVLKQPVLARLRVLTKRKPKRNKKKCYSVKQPETRAQAKQHRAQQKQKVQERKAQQQAIKAQQRLQKQMIQQAKAAAARQQVATATTTAPPSQQAAPQALPKHASHAPRVLHHFLALPKKRRDPNPLHLSTAYRTQT